MSFLSWRWSFRCMLLALPLGAALLLPRLGLGTADEVPHPGGAAEQPPTEPAGGEEPKADGTAPDESPAPPSADGTPQDDAAQASDDMQEQPEAAPAASGKPTAKPAKPAAADKEPTEPNDSAAPDPAKPAGGTASVRGTASIAPASFKEMQPGESTERELTEAWGPAKEVKQLDGSERHVYQIDGFDRVLVTLSGGKVRAIAVRLSKALPPKELARQLQLDAIVPVAVDDSAGRPLGQAYPERGVLFSFATGGKTVAVSEVVLEEIDPQSFALRAEERLRSHPTASLADVTYALGKDPANARSWWLRACVLEALGELSAARKAADKALELAPDSAEYRLSLAHIEALLADYASAAPRNEDVINTAGVEPLVKARALCQLGDCLARSTERKHAQAIKHHQDAIKLAEPLATSRRKSERRAAKEILLDAHLGVAYDVAWGRWRDKPRVVPKWLERSKEVATNLVEQEHGDRDLLLRIARAALEASAGFKDPTGVSQWIDDAQSVGKKLVDEAADPARKASLSWTLGLALSDAAEIAYGQRRAGEAAQYGAAAVELLTAGERFGRQAAGHDYLVGRTHYRLGVLCAVDRQDHQQATTWYEKAVPLLEKPVPPSLVDQGRLGETFVSIAVSYWETGGRDEALRLTSQGARLMEKGVEEGVLDKATLAVPYGNLASMHEHMGNGEEADKFAELAARYQRGKQK